MSNTQEPNRWNIASGRNDFALLVKAANQTGIQLVFKRNELVAGVVGRNLVESFLEKEKERKKYPTGNEFIHSLNTWKTKVNYDKNDLPLENEDVFPRDRTSTDLRDPFLEKDVG